MRDPVTINLRHDALEAVAKVGFIANARKAEPVVSPPCPRIIIVASSFDIPGHHVDLHGVIPDLGGRVVSTCARFRNEPATDTKYGLTAR